MPSQALPLISGGQDRARELGNLFILDTEQPDAKAREACLLALQALGLKSKELKERYCPLYLEHPNPAARKRYLEAFFVYADKTPWREEVLRWIPHLASHAISVAQRAVEAAKLEDWDGARAALEEVRTCHPRLLSAARLDEAKAQIVVLKEHSRIRAEQNLVYQQYQGGYSDLQRLRALEAVEPSAPARAKMAEQTAILAAKLRDLWPQLSELHRSRVVKV